MTVVGIDPGPKESAYVTWDGEKIVNPVDGFLSHCTVPNEDMLSLLLILHRLPVAIEWIEGFGLRVGQETFDTCRWVGRFEQAAGGIHLLGRKAISSHLCNVAQAGDKFIRQALIARIGEPGTKRVPGPTYGIVGHEWSALACAVVYWDQQHQEKS